LADILRRQMPRRQFLRITAIAGISMALGGGLMRELLRNAGLREVTETRTRMATPVTLTVVHSDVSAARGIVSETFGEMTRLERILSRHRPDTPVSMLNRYGFVEEAPAELIEVITTAIEYSAMTGGAFDVTVHPLVDLYASSFAQTGIPPADQAVEHAVSLVDYREVVVEGRGITLTQPGMSITLDGIAKGFVVDRAVATLKSLGSERVLVDAGGDLGSLGAGSGDEGWSVAIQHPRSHMGALGLVRLSGQSVATSGDYVQYFTPDKRYHHILDPRSGKPPESTSSVTVVAPTTMAADVMSTAAFVLGATDGLQLIDRSPGVEGLVVTKTQEIHRSSGLRLHPV